MNLTLRVERHGGCGLWQTPTGVTYAALASNDPKAVYFAWLDADADRNKPNIHPRATKSQIKAIKGSRAWKEYMEDVERVTEHKQIIEDYLCANPTARWGMQ